MSQEKPNEARTTRRGFLAEVGRGASVFALGGLAGSLYLRGDKKEMVWQIDPFKCNRCGQCQTECVLDQSAVKCVHDFAMCGYCEFCFGFFRTDAVDLDEGAENQRCPTGAIARKLVEAPYFQYTIDKDLCIACADCVKGCTQFGNGALYLQVRHDYCLNCSECSIAAACPTDAFVRLPADQPYFLKSRGPGQLSRAFPMG